MFSTYPTTATPNTMINSNANANANANANSNNSFDAAVPSYPYQQQQQSQPQPQALVPATATAPGNTNNNNIYNNYAVPTTTSNTYNTSGGDDDLIDFGRHVVGDGTAYSSQQQISNDDDLISFDNSNSNSNSNYNTNMSFASIPSPPTHQPTTVAAARNIDSSNLKALQDRDDEFVKNLPRELIEEQKRILDQIQKSNNTNSNYSNTISRSQSQVVTSYSSHPTTNNNDGQQLYQQKFNASLPDESSIQNSHSQLPQEVHPKKYQMKDARKVKTAASATTGAVVGGLLFGPAWPVGAVAGAAVGGYAGKVISRKGERKQQVKHDIKNFNNYAGQGKADVQSENVTFA
jgi:uncharacterized protein YcfJ